MRPGKALAGPGPKDSGQPGATPSGGALCLLPSHPFLFILVHQPPSFSTPTTPPCPTPTHPYTDIVSRMMFPDLHVLSLAWRCHTVLTPGWLQMEGKPPL